MLLGLPVLVALALGLCCGGSLRNVAQFPVRGSGWLLASLAIQFLLYAPALRAAPWVQAWGAPIYVGALALALVGAGRNWRLGGAVRVAMLGLALNALVITLNGGVMPVDAAAMRAVQGADALRTLGDPRVYSNARLAAPGSRLIALSDILPVRLPRGRGNVYSVGDVLLAGGVALAMYGAARGRFLDDAMPSVGVDAHGTAAGPAPRPGA